MRICPVYNLGNVFRVRGEWSEAAVSYRRALEWNAAYAEAHNNSSA